MRKGIKWALLFVAGVLVVIQFFRPDRNLQPVGGDDLLVLLEPPAEVAQLLKNSCYDCHSDQTRYPWYSHVAPVSWFLDSHIREGKEEVNFSQFGALEKGAKIGVLTEICEVVEEGSMPLPGYLRLHRDAVLDEEQAGMLCEWSELEALKLLRR